MAFTYSEATLAWGSGARPPPKRMRGQWSGSELELLVLLMIEEGENTEEFAIDHVLDQQRRGFLCLACKDLLYSYDDAYVSIRHCVFQRQASGPVTIEGTRVMIDIRKAAR